MKHTPDHCGVVQFRKRLTATLEQIKESRLVRDQVRRYLILALLERDETLTEIATRAGSTQSNLSQFLFGTNRDRARARARNTYDDIARAFGKRIDLKFVDDK